MSWQAWKWVSRIGSRLGHGGPGAAEPREQSPEGPRRLQWTPELVGRFWNGVSRSRLNDLSFSKQGGRGLVVAIDHLLPRDGRIVDFGAGDGDLIRHLTERGLKVAAYEPSKERREHLAKQLADCPSFLGVIGGRGRTRFDVAIMAEVVEHILDEELVETLRRLASWVKPGGALVVTTPKDEDLELGMAYCPVSNTLFHRWQHVRSFSRESLCALLDRFGFDEVATHYVSFEDRLYVPWDDLWGEPEAAGDLPDYMLKLRRDEPARIGSETNLLFVGRKRAGR